ncbi:MAG TPA: 4Fe-4S dicluster domain-containing protein, partial [Ferruginibacter sp.]|nr:4Fe-4S dicluster domain-containing protein [Ferruginibacter sp.]
GVLLDKNSIVVAYDHKRGEARGKYQKPADHDCKCVDCKEEGACKSIAEKFSAFVEPVQGDCIDCGACVRVCPTGIDIRNGTQLECINCTACIDACDAIMTAIHKPTGLIRYASENTIVKKEKLRFSGRIKGYTAILSLLLSLLVFLLVSRSDLDVTLMRTSGMSYSNMPDGTIANLYNLKLVNKTHEDIPFSMKLENSPGEIMIVGNNNPIAKKEDYATLQFFIKLKPSDVTSWKTILKIGLYERNKKLKTVTAKFIGPEVYN